MAAKRTVPLHSVLHQTIGPSWVFLFEGLQILQPWVSTCLSVGTSPGGKQTRCLPCPLPTQSFSLLQTSYIWWGRSSVQRDGETERYASHVLTLVLTVTIVIYWLSTEPSIKWWTWVNKRKNSGSRCTLNNNITRAQTAWVSLRCQRENQLADWGLASHSDPRLSNPAKMRKKRCCGQKNIGSI